MKLIETVKNLKNDVVSHWVKPAPGKQVSYRELASYSVGGIGVQFILNVVGYFALASTSLLLTLAIKISLSELQTMVVISSIVGFFTSPLRGMLFDNTRSKKGKFRPYLLYTGIPSVILACCMVFMPYDSMSGTVKFVTVLVLYNLLNFFSPFYSTAYNSLPMVMSSDSNERNNVYSISSVIYSLAPTITGTVLPLMGDMSKLTTYQLAVPIFGIIGAGIGMLAYFGTKERIVVSKRYVPRVGFFTGLKQLAKNKYFWLIYSSGWLGFLATAAGPIFNWVFVMGMNKDNDHPEILSLLILISGSAALPGMLFAATLIRKFGVKRIVLFSMIVQMISVAFIFLSPNSYVLVFTMLYIKNFAGSLGIVYTPSMKADILDYEQYRSGKRIDGMMEQIGGLIGSVLGMVTGYAVPFILKYAGLVNNYDDLRNDAFRGKIVGVSALCTAVGIFLSMIPFLFYNLSEKQHKNIVNVLHIRKFFEDYGNNELDETEMIQTIAKIHDAENALKLPFDENNKKSKDAYLSAKITIDELNKFKTPQMHEKVTQARLVYAGGPKTAKIPSELTLKNALEMPENTKEETKLRKTAIKAAEKEINSFEDIEKEYIKARNLLREEETFSKYDEIYAKYESIMTVAKV